MKKVMCVVVAALLVCCVGKKDVERPDSYNYQRGCEAVEKHELDEAMRRATMSLPIWKWTTTWTDCGTQRNTRHWL